MIGIVLEIFLFSFFLNFVWEASQSVLYKTCQEKTLNNYVIYIFKVSLSDGFWISAFYLLTVFVFNNQNILGNDYQLSFFIVIAVLSAFAWEKISLKYKRWQYTDKMPLFFGAGITPMFQLAITGIITFLFVFLG